MPEFVGNDLPGFPVRFSSGNQFRIPFPHHGVPDGVLLNPAFFMEFPRWFISCMDLSDENIKEFAKIIKARNIDYKRWHELFKRCDSGLLWSLLAQKDFSEDSDFFHVKDYLDDICKDKELKLPANDVYHLYGKFLKKIDIMPREDIEFLLNEGVSYCKIENFHLPLVRNKRKGFQVYDEDL